MKKKKAVPAQQMEPRAGKEEVEEKDGREGGRLVSLRRENFGRTAKSVGAWQRHKEPWLSIQLRSTPLWQTCHHRLCLHGSVHCWEPRRKMENELQ